MMSTIDALRTIHQLSRKDNLVKGHFLQCQRALTALGVSDKDRDEFNRILGFTRSLIESFGPTSIVVYYSYNHRGYTVRVFNQDLEQLVYNQTYNVTSLVKLSDIKDAAFKEAEALMHKFNAHRIIKE